MIIWYLNLFRASYLTTAITEWVPEQNLTVNVIDPLSDFEFWDFGRLAQRSVRKESITVTATADHHSDWDCRYYSC